MSEEYEIGENVFWIRVWSLVTLFFCVLVVSMCTTCYAVNKKAFECGYERTTVPGYSDAVWTKVRE